MMDITGGITSFLVHSALDALTSRQKVIANNIANANTTGFSPIRMAFEQQLQHLASLSVQPNIESTLVRKFGDFEHDLLNGRMAQTEKGKSVELDVEMARLTDNLIRYQALLEGMSKRTAVLKMAVTGGRG
ncbi:MAG: flagellar basal body rod protein FlgB [Candidatus Sedimenticola sp. (ex Thyasira tokunagai)]